MNIGFFNPDSHLYVDVTTVLEHFAKDGHKVVLMTLTPKGNIQKALENKGIIFEQLDDGKPKRVYQTLSKAKAVAKICKKHELDVLYNNFAITQIISLLAKPFCKTKMIYLRHHSTDAAQQYSNRKGIILDKIMNLSGSTTIVPSQRVRQDTIKEGVRPENVTLIPYCYNFESYPKVNDAEVREIKSRFAGKKILLMISRYVPQKRYEIAVEIAKKLRDSGSENFVFLCLGNGHLEDDIRKQVAANGLQEMFFLEGFKENVMTYIAACDMLVHTSASEASCHAIKEAGWLYKNVICCENVGDFSDYLVDGENAFLVEKDFPVEPMFERISRFLRDGNEKYQPLADELHKNVTNLFTPEAVLPKHYELIKSLVKQK